MHQKIDSEEPIDFNAIVGAIGKVTPHATMPTVGWGKKLMFQAQHKQDENYIVLEFFSEVTFEANPANPNEGFTPEDVSRSRGVNILDVELEPMDDGSGYHKSSGMMMPYEEFVERYITDIAVRAQLDTIMDKMDESIESGIGERLLEQVNGAWENRPDKDSGLYKITYN